MLDGVGILRNSTCIFRNTEPNLVSFYNDQQITEEVVEFPPGSLLVSFVKEKNLEDKGVSLPKRVEPDSLIFGMLDLWAALKCDRLKSKDIDCLLFWYIFKECLFHEDSNAVLSGSQNSVVGIMTRLQDGQSGIRFPVGARDFSLLHIQTTSGSTYSPI